MTMSDTIEVTTPADQPQSDLPANPPTGTAGGIGLCCACPVSGVVDRETYGVYYTSTYDDEYIRNACSIDITRTATGGEVIIKTKFILAYENGATETEHNGRLGAAIHAALKNWAIGGRAYRIQVKQPGCETQLLKIAFTAEYVAEMDASTLTVVADNTIPEVDSEGKTENLLSYLDFESYKLYLYMNASDKEATMTHEWGHAFGLTDEYVLDSPTADRFLTATFYGADTPDKTITLPPSSAPPENPGQFSFSSLSIMGNFYPFIENLGSTSPTLFPDYLYYWIAIEVKEILKREGVNAEVKLVPASES